MMVKMPISGNHD